MGRSKKYTQFTPVEMYIDPYNTSILWYYIPGFNGYEISNTGIVRSMKHYKKYPFGILIRPRETKDPIDLFTKFYGELTYELSDNNNIRQVITRSELLGLASNNKQKIDGYPRRTIVTDISPRNIRCFVKRKPVISPKDQIHKVEFYYEKDNNSNIQSGEQLNREDKVYIIKPLIFNDGEE